MSEKISFLLQDVVSTLAVQYHCKEDVVPQISSYQGEIKICDFLDHNFCLATHQLGSHGHIILIGESFAAMQYDEQAQKMVEPLAIVTIKDAEKPEDRYVALHPAQLEKIYLNTFTSECLKVFLTLVQLAYQKRL